MSSSQKQSFSSSSVVEKFHSQIATHENLLRNAISKQAIFQADSLYPDHLKTSGMLTNRLPSNAKEQLVVILEQRWIDLVEQHEEKIWLNSGKNLDSHLCIYLEEFKVQMVGYTKKLGHIKVNFGTENDHTVTWRKCKASTETNSPDHDIVILEEQSGPRVQLHQLLSYIEYHNHPVGKNPKAIELMTGLFRQMKSLAESQTGESICQILLVADYCLNFFTQRDFLRKCSKMAGFQRVLIVRDKCFAAYRLFKSLPLTAENVSALAVVIHLDSPGFTLHIYGCDLSVGKITGVKSMSYVWGLCTKEVIKMRYEEALSHLTMQRKDSIRYYTVTNNYREDRTENIVDEYFRIELKIIKFKSGIFDNCREIFLRLPHADSDSMQTPFDIAAGALTGISRGSST